MLGLWNLQWLNHNSQRAYPLSESCARTAYISQNIKIPDDLILALRISLNTGHNVMVDKFFLKALTVTGNGFAILIGYDDGSDYTNPDDYPSVATTFVWTNSNQNTYSLTGLDDFEDSVGYIAVDSSCAWLNEVSGYFSFLPQNTYLEPDCIVPMIQSISSVSVSDGTTIGTRHYGDIILQAGSNVELEVKESASATTIIIHAITTDDFTEQCKCDIHEQAPCIKTINSMHPDASGNILMEGTGCVQLANANGTITFTDTCASPRCNCDSLQDLAQEIRDLEDGVTTLENFTAQMKASVDQTQLVITNSKVDYA